MSMLAWLPVTLVFSTLFNFFTPKKLPDKNFIELLNTSTLFGSFLLLYFVNVAIYVYDIYAFGKILYITQLLTNDCDEHASRCQTWSIKALNITKALPQRYSINFTFQCWLWRCWNAPDKQSEAQDHINNPVCEYFKHLQFTKLYILHFMNTHKTLCVTHPYQLSLISGAVG